jgi:hypothetical protein
MYRIEVDEDVYEFLKKHAEPFVDKDENSVLRKLLLGKKVVPAKKEVEFRANGKNSGNSPDLPAGIPDGLGYILEIVYLLKKGITNSRIEATKMVAERHNIKYSTVAEKYAQQLDKSADDIDRMLDDIEYIELRNVLKARSPKYNGVIKNILI